VGSITHCDGYCACAVALRSDVAAIGIDAEPHEPLSERVLTGIATVGERRRLAAEDSTELELGRILFSAKETVFKAWFPYADRPLGFKDCDVVLDTSSARFRAILTPPGVAVGGVELAELRGRWRVQDGLVVTAVVVEATAGL
jgi:4'-phosphopantetheinyl transferase EntD